MATARVVSGTEVFIGLGANLGDARATVQQAIGHIAALPLTHLVRQSSLYRTAPVDAAGADFVNAVIEISTGLTALALLQALQTLEQQAGRQRPYRNAPRTLDLDILLYGELCMALPELSLPHPRMWQRAFVLLPLAEIAPHRVAGARLDAVKEQRIVKIVAANS